MNSLLFLVAFSPAAAAQEDADAAIAVARAKAQAQNQVKEAPVLSYAQGYKLAVETGRPLLTFVGYAPFTPNGTDAIVCQEQNLSNVVRYPNEFPAKCVLVSVPSGDDLKWFRTVTDPTEDNLWRAIIDSNGFGPKVDAGPIKSVQDC